MGRMDREISETDRAWFQLGRLDREPDLKATYIHGKQEGRAEAAETFEKRINMIVKSQGKLYRELLRVDKAEPVAGVLIPYYFAETIIKLLRHKNKHSYHARMLRNFINKSNIDWKQALKNIENDLKEADEE